MTSLSSFCLSLSVTTPTPTWVWQPGGANLLQIMVDVPCQLLKLWLPRLVTPLGVTTVRLPLPPFFSPSLKLRGIGVLFDLIYPLSPNHLSQFLSPHLISVSLYFYFQLHHPLIPKSLHLQSSWLLSRSLALWWDRWLRGLLDTWWCVTAETEAPLNVISAGLIAVFHARPMQQGTALPPHVQSSAWFWRAYLAFRQGLFEEPTET